MVEFLTWLQNSGPATWVRESDSLLGYTLYLAGHTIGMVFLVGPNLLIAARVLGLAPRLPLAPLRSFRPLMTIGLWITIVTGSVLFATAPVGYVHNRVFIVKIIAIAFAVACVRGALRELFDRTGTEGAESVSHKAITLTAASVLLWTIAVVAGRLTAYSGIVVVASVEAFLILLAVAAAILWMMRLRVQRVAERSGALRIDLQPTAVKGGK
jgi:hypothetical protein